jgi:hypothetical protein
MVAVAGFFSTQRAKKREAGKQMESMGARNMKLWNTGMPVAPTKMKNITQEQAMAVAVKKP